MRLIFAIKKFSLLTCVPKQTHYTCKHCIWLSVNEFKATVKVGDILKIEQKCKAAYALLTIQAVLIYYEQLKLPVKK